LILPLDGSNKSPATSTYGCFIVVIFIVTPLPQNEMSENDVTPTAA